MSKQKILIIDDDISICDIVKFNLELAGYDVTTVNSARKAQDMGVAKFDLILLDVMMSDMTGFEFAKIIKSDNATKDVPIMFMTAKDDEDDVIHGFDLGADDYVEKPFSMRELTARVRVVLARTSLGRQAPPQLLTHKTMTLNCDNATLLIDGKQVALTRQEFELLKMFLSNKGRLFAREEIVNEAWPDNVYVSDRTVDVSITRLRKKLGAYAKCLVSRTGFGYCFE